MADWVKIERGVWQGCVMAPLFFSTYGKNKMRQFVELDILSLGGKNLNNVRYADNAVLIADSMEKLQRCGEGGRCWREDGTWHHQK